jgi:hypothetical protein
LGRGRGFTYEASPLPLPKKGKSGYKKEALLRRYTHNCEAKRSLKPLNIKAKQHQI